MLVKIQMNLAKFSLYISWERNIIMNLISFPCPQFIVLKNKKVQITWAIFKTLLKMKKPRIYLKVSIRLLDFRFLELGRLLPGFQGMTVVSRHLLVWLGQKTIWTNKNH